MLVRLYRCLPAAWRDKIYVLFLGKILEVIRNPRLTCQEMKLKRMFKSYISHFREKEGIEIGGPTSLFGEKEIFPVYKACKEIDGCNYASVTVWEGKIQDSAYRYQGAVLGTQYIGEATEVASLVNGKRYDFVISSNCLEHVANPVKALRSWLEILKEGGVLLLIVPNKKNNFDRRRPDTPFEHLMQDYEHEVTEDDNTHYEEILALHDLSLDSGVKDAESFKKRCLNNKENRCFHHHVFHPHCLQALFNYLDISILMRYSTEADHIILGQKR